MAVLGLSPLTRGTLLQGLPQLLPGSEVPEAQLRPSRAPLCQPSGKKWQRAQHLWPALPAMVQEMGASFIPFSQSPLGAPSHDLTSSLYQSNPSRPVFFPTDTGNSGHFGLSKLRKARHRAWLPTARTAKKTQSGLRLARAHWLQEAVGEPGSSPLQDPSSGASVTPHGCCLPGLYCGGPWTPSSPPVPCNLLPWRPHGPLPTGGFAVLSVASAGRNRAKGRAGPEVGSLTLPRRRVALPHQVVESVFVLQPHFPSLRSQVMFRMVLFREKRDWL